MADKFTPRQRRLLVLAGFFFCHFFPYATVAQAREQLSWEERKDREEKRKAYAKMGAVKKWAPRKWKNAYIYNGRNYRVITDTSAQTAKYIAKMMDLIAKEYRKIFGYRYGQIPVLPIHAYASMAEYNVVANRLGLPPGTSGFFTPTGSGAIHLPYVMLNNRHPITTLYHEGTHQFIYRTINFRLPILLRKKLPKQYEILPSVPIWLNEGLATYMETAYFDGVQLDIGRVNRSRLASLQQSLRQKANPSIGEVLERRYGMPFGIEHYNVSWGLVYALRHDYHLAERDRNRRNLLAFVKRCRRGFMNAPSLDFPKLFMRDGKLVKNFSTLWNAYIAKQSRKQFIRLIVGPRQTLAQWEKNWEKRILRMDYNKPYGGTFRGGDRGDERLR